MDTQNIVDFLHNTRWDDLPAPVQEHARLALLDLLGVAAGGALTRLSGIITDHAATDFPGAVPMLFDGRPASPPGAALAAGMMIDSLDGHDGFNPSKGHIGCPVFAGVYAHFADPGSDLSGDELLTTLAIGYEFGARLAIAQHRSVPDYHTSGSWGAVAAAAATARLMHLGTDTTRHALGIAEYHGPRSQMMRCIDHPTMLKDGSGWGAMAGVSATRLAVLGFTGAPALTFEDAPDIWADLGTRWYGLEQYFKPYPVCRWAQAPVEAVLALRRTHALTATQVARITVTSFHEAIRLATAAPRTTEEAQYSTSFPCAVALVRGDVTPSDIDNDALQDPEILRLSKGLQMEEHDHANAAFPLRRYARVRLDLTDGRVLESDWHEPRWDHTAPPTQDALRQKFRTWAGNALGTKRATSLETLVDALDTRPASALFTALSQPIRR